MDRGIQIDVNKLRRLILENAGDGKRFTRRGLSMAASGGRNPDLVRDLMRVNNRKPTIETVSGICQALDVPLSDIVNGVEPSVGLGTEWLKVGGAVAAGIWKEQTEWSPDDWYEIEVDASEFPGEHFGLLVEGRSMDRALPHGTVLRCVGLIGRDIEFQDGDYVIVERFQGALRELTCKRLHRRLDGNWELVAESFQPEFRDPIFVGKPSDTGSEPGFDGISDDEIRVKALVIDAYLPIGRRRKRPAQ